MKIKRRILVAVMVVAALLLLFSVGWIYRSSLLDRAGVNEPLPKKTEEPAEREPSSEAQETESGKPKADGEETQDNTSETAEYECPTELSEAMEINSDVYAWLTVTGTEISYPICNNPDSNAYYLTHDSNRNWNPMGALYTENYNARDFSDPAVVVYGHSMTGKKYFGTLQKDYSSKTFFDEHREIKVYLADRELTFTVFAAVPFSNAHILYYYDFSAPFYYRNFLRTALNTKSLESLIDSEITPEPGDQLLILSTCLKGSNYKRFLLLAVNNDAFAENENNIS